MRDEEVGNDLTGVVFVLALLVALPFYFWVESLSATSKVLALLVGPFLLVCISLLWYSLFSNFAKERKKRLEAYDEIPENLKIPFNGSVKLGRDTEFTIPIYLPDKIRSRHVHILGSTGSGKTESVILNLLKQDIKLGRGAIILDAKGDDSFQRNLKIWLPPERLCIMDLANAQSMGFDPIRSGSPMEAAQRLHASLPLANSDKPVSLALQGGGK